MRFLACLGMLGLLSACAPSTTSSPPSSGSISSGSIAPASASGDTFRAAFSAQGMAWVSGGKACVARAPSFQAVCPSLARVSDVAWNDGDAWAAVPSLRLIVTLDRAARTVPVGAVTVLSSTRAYREDGSAVTYQNQPAGGVPGRPSRALTDGSGQDYVVLAGRLLRLSDQRVLETELTGPELLATENGVQSVSVPTAQGEGSTYRLQGGTLERVDVAGKVIGRVPHTGGAVGIVGQQVVTVNAAGQIRHFTLDLQELRP